MIVRRARATRTNSGSWGAAPSIAPKGDACAARNAERKDTSMLSIGRPLVGVVCAAGIRPVFRGK